MAGSPNSDRLRRMSAGRLTRLRALLATIAPLATLAMIIALAPPAAAQQAIATFERGRFAVGSADWDFGPVDVTMPGSPGELLSVQHFGTLRYPAAAEGAGTPAAQGGPFPFVVFSHGRFHEAPFIGHNHEQASYLLDHLASWGFVVASVNLDVVGQFGSPSAIKQRGELALHTIEGFEALAALDPARYDVDFAHIGLVGHSRGGEGCLAAWKNNDAGHAIEAIATIAPTNYQDQLLTGVPYLGLYGSKDGDVNNGWPIQVYDQASQAAKLFEYVEGANHFWFTDSIHFAGEGQALITREQHHDLARTYITAFLLSTLRDEPPEGPHVPLTELCDGPSLFPVTGPIVVHPIYSDPDALVVNHFEDEDADPGHNSLGGASVGELLMTQDEESLDNNAKSFFHRTRGGWIAYMVQGEGAPGGGRPGAALGFIPVYVEELPGGVDASAYSHLSLNALQRWNAPLNPEGQSQDLHLLQADGRGRSAQVQLSDWGTIPWPVTHGGSGFPKKSVLRTTRIPLREFHAANPLLDLTDIRLASLVFDQSPTADLRIDDLSFTR
jgi:dienelactone hydrolase